MSGSMRAFGRGLRHDRNLMRAIVTGSRPYTDGFKIKQTLLGQARALDGETLEIVRRETGGAESIAGYLAREYVGLGIVDVPIKHGPLSLEGVDICWVFLERGSNRRRALRMIERCNEVGIYVEVTVTD